MVFLIDGTEDVTTPHFNGMRDLVLNTIYGYNLGPSSTRVALGVYGVLNEIGSFTTQFSHDKNELAVFLSGMNRVGGKREMGAALDFAMNRYGGGSSTSSLKKQVYIMFTTGSNQLIDMQRFSSVVERLENAGNELFLVALGNSVDLSQYLDVIVSQRNLFNAVNLNALPDFLHQLLILNMPVAGT